jgi:hypothetical protein
MLAYFLRLYVVFRYIRLTTRRYGLLALAMKNYRPRRAGVGHGIRSNPFGRAHDRLSDASMDAMDLVRMVRLERSNDTTRVIIAA